MVKRCILFATCIGCRKCQGHERVYCRSTESFCFSDMCIQVQGTCGIWTPDIFGTRGRHSVTSYSWLPSIFAHSVLWERKRACLCSKISAIVVPIVRGMLETAPLFFLEKTVLSSFELLSARIWHLLLGIFEPRSLAGASIILQVIVCGWRWQEAIGGEPMMILTPTWQAWPTLSRPGLLWGLKRCIQVWI